MSTNQNQRPRYYEDQYLGADDLNDAVDYGRIRDARHALGAHTWGIALGLEIVERERAGGAIDVYVTPGYAWDGFGRPIVMLEPTPLGAQLFQAYLFQVGVNDQKSEGRLFTVWIAYDEQTGVGPRPGFEACDVDDQNRRVEERFKLEVTEFRPPDPPLPPPPVRGIHDNINVAGQSVDPPDALNAPKVPSSGGSSSSSSVNQTYDESIPFQMFPVLGERKRWPIPIGVVRWQPAQETVPGRFIKRNEKDPDDLVEHRRARRYIGVTAESVEATAGHVRIKDRKQDNQRLWTDDLAWIEGKLRVHGDTRLLDGALLLRNEKNDDKDFPVTIRRTAVSTSKVTNKVLQVLIGSDDNGDNRFSIGPEVNSNVKEKFSVLDNGKVGIGTVSPGSQLTIFAENDGGTDALRIHGAAESPTKYGLLNVHDSDDYLRLAYLDGTLKRNIFLDGKVGIGMSTPVGRLTLEGIVQQQGQLSFFTDDGDMVYDGGDGGLFVFQNTNAEGKTAFLGSKVGIGTKSPEGKVDVDESGSSAGSRLKIGHTSAGYAHHITSFRDMVLNSHNGFYIRHNPTPGDPIKDHKELVSITQDAITQDATVGIGMPALTNPTGTLDVRGDIKLHTDGSLFAPGGVENLRIIVGHVKGDDGTRLTGAGFNSARNAPGNYSVTFVAPFTGLPVVVVSPVNSSEDDNLLTIKNLTEGGFQVLAKDVTPGDEGKLQDTAFTFIAMGLRV